MFLIIFIVLAIFIAISYYDYKLYKEVDEQEIIRDLKIIRGDRNDNDKE